MSGRTVSWLGLMIVQRILRDHGGEIEISSTIGRGTVLTLHFLRDDVRMTLLEAPGRSTRKTGRRENEE